MAKATAFTLPSPHVVQIEDDKGNFTYQFPPTKFQATSLAAGINGEGGAVQNFLKLLPKRRGKSKDDKDE